MKLEEQVCSLELARELQELGVKQKGVFRWRIRHDESKGGINLASFWDEHKAVYPESIYSEYSAFTVAELGALLPDFIYQYKTSGQWAIWWVALEESNYPIFRNDTQANNLARMLIWCIKQGKVTL